nr:hypothetical protein [uncultured Arsenicibacter sp.]
MTPSPTIHPRRFRALAYEILNQLTGGKPVTTSSPEIREIEAEMRHQYGFLLEQEAEKQLRSGQKPDPDRIKTAKVPLTKDSCSGCDRMLRYADISQYIYWQGKPFITHVGTCDVEFVPANRPALARTSERLNSPTYATEGKQLIVRLTRDTALLDYVEVTGIPKDPFNGAGPNDSEIWRYPWDATEAMRALVKERTEIRFRNGTVATWQRQDKVNNGQENPVINQ